MYHISGRYSCISYCQWERKLVLLKAGKRIFYYPNYAFGILRFDIKNCIIYAHF